MGSSAFRGQDLGISGAWIWRCPGFASCGFGMRILGFPGLDSWGFGPGRVRVQVFSYKGLGLAFCEMVFGCRCKREFVCRFDG